MNLIVNVNKQWGIGKDGDLLCHIKQDMNYFKDKTFGHTIIYGRKTLDSFPGGNPLVGRKNIVLTHDISKIRPEVQHYGHYYCTVSKVESVSRKPGNNSTAGYAKFAIIRDQNNDDLNKYGRKPIDTTSLFSTKNIRDAISLGNMLEVDTRKVFICGGESIYKAFLPYCEYAYVTINNCDKEADAFFPNLDENENWEKMTDGKTYIDEKSGIEFKFCIYRNKNCKSIYEN